MGEVQEKKNKRGYKIDLQMLTYISVFTDNVDLLFLLARGEPAQFLPFRTLAPVKVLTWRLPHSRGTLDFHVLDSAD